MNDELKEYLRDFDGRMIRLRYLVTNDWRSWKRARNRWVEFEEAWDALTEILRSPPDDDE